MVHGTGSDWSKPIFLHKICHTYKTIYISTIIALKNTQVILKSKACKYLLLHQDVGDLMKIWDGYDWYEITFPNDSGKLYCDNCKLYDAYYILIDSEHIFLLEMEICKSWMNQNDENLSELELKSFWYKSNKKHLYRNGFSYIFLSS